MKKIKPVLVAVLLTTLLTGCGEGTNESKQTYTQLSSGKLIEPSRPDGLLSGADPENPYPVIDNLDLTLYASIKYFKKNGETEEKKYIWIDQAYVSEEKVKEGKNNCSSDQLKLLSYDSCTGKSYSFSKLTLKDSSSKLNSENYTDEAYVLEKNYRGETLVKEPDKVFDIVFLYNKKRSEDKQLAKGGKFFDVFLLEELQSNSFVLDTADKDRGETMTSYGKDATQYRVPLSLRQIIEDCGQKTRIVAGPEMIGESQWGKSETGDSEVLSRIVPDSVSLDGVSTIENSALLNVEWLLGGRVAFDGKTKDLGTSVKDFQKIDRGFGSVKSEYVGSSLYENGATVYLILKVIIGGEDQKYLYHPAVAQPAQYIPSTNSTNKNTDQINWQSITQDLLPISLDPWCGFSPSTPK